MENQKVKSLFEKFIGWSQGGFLVDNRSIKKNHGLFIFFAFSEKMDSKTENWTFGGLKVQFFVWMLFLCSRYKKH